MSSQTLSSSWALPAALTHPKSTDAAHLQMGLMPNKIKDEFEDYTKGSRVPKLDSSVYDWWKTQDHIPSVGKMAYDHLCVPAMSSETERYQIGHFRDPQAS